MPKKKTYAIEWRPLAREDLRSIIQYIAKDSGTRAGAFGNDLRDRVSQLSRFPNLGRPGRIEGTRELVAHPNYIVYYRVREDARQVQILRVKHAARQWP
ncbi:MAG: type II toxin-antitoxin system RelE/ParE family toxin [Alphaproteobacteria bacterium]